MPTNLKDKTVVQLRQLCKKKIFVLQNKMEDIERNHHY